MCKDSLLNIKLQFQCQCKGDTTYKKVTAVGCSGGGLPSCPNGGVDDLVCGDGEKLNREKAVAARFENK